MIQKLLSLFAKPAPAPENAAPVRLGISAMTLARASEPPAPVDIAPYDPPAGVIPAAERVSAMAMDATPYDFVNGVYSGAHFKGYPYLALLSQQPEYRKMAETIAKQMTRKWIKVKSKGDDDKSEKVQAMEDALLEFKVQDAFRKAAELDGFFGRGQIYIDVKTPGGMPAQADSEELATILLRSPAKIKKDSLIGFKVVEPVWTYPSAYNSDNPLAADYYKPTSWFVMGKTVHASRMLMFASREVPDLLKASYNFGGLSLSQLAEPYVNNWLRTRDSVSDTVHSFSITGLKTNMGSTLSGGTDDGIFARAGLFTKIRDNRGLFLIDKAEEEIFQVNTPLSGLDALQSQALEQLSACSNIPLVFMTGIAPSGLNATSDGEIKVFHSYIRSMQETLFGANLDRVFEIVQLSKFGEIDADIGYEFESLDEVNDVEQATIRKTEADTDAVLIGAGVISADDARERLIADEGNGYHSLEANPELGEADELEDDGQAQDAEFNEGDHPRAGNGQFGSGNNGGMVSKSTPSAGKKFKDKWGDKFTAIGPDPKDSSRIMALEDGMKSPVSIPVGNIALTVSKPEKKKSPVKSDDPVITLYHGSTEESIEIKDKGVFGGLFASGRESAAASHGNGNIHKIDLKKSQVMTQQHLDELSDADLKAVAPWVEDDDIDRLRELVIDDKQTDEDDARIMKTDDSGEASWEAQRLRGALAKKMGFKAVEMNDEHGTSYLVLPGTDVKRKKNGNE